MGRAKASIGEVPPEAKSGGAINAAGDERSLDKKEAKLGDGPKVHEETGAYLPCKYNEVVHQTDKDGKSIEGEITVEHH